MYKFIKKYILILVFTLLLCPFNINALVAKVVSVLGNFPKPSFVSELLLNGVKA